MLQTIKDKCVNFLSWLGMYSVPPQYTSVVPEGKGIDAEKVKLTAAVVEAPVEVTNTPRVSEKPKTKKTQKPRKPRTKKPKSN